LKFFLSNEPAISTKPHKPSPLQQLQKNHVNIDLSADEEYDSHTQSLTTIAKYSEDTLSILDNSKAATTQKQPNSIPFPLQHLQRNHVFIDLSADEEIEPTHSVNTIANHSEDTLRILNLANQANLNIDNFNTVLNYPHPQLLLKTKFNIPIT